MNLSETEVKELEGKALSITEVAGALQVRSEEDMVVAHGHLKAIKGLIREVKETFDPVVEAAHRTHKEAVAAKKKHLEPLEENERVIKGKIGTYIDICEAERLVAEQAAREAAAKEQEKALRAAKKRIDILIARGGDLIEQIARLKSEGEKPGLSDIEAAAIVAQIEVLEAQAEGNAEKVEAKKAAAVEAPVPIPVTTAPRAKTKGISSTVKKVVTVIDLMALVKAVAAGTIPIGALTPNTKALEKLANAGMKIPGTTISDKRSVAVR